MIAHGRHKASLVSANYLENRGLEQISELRQQLAQLRHLLTDTQLAKRSDVDEVLNETGKLSETMQAVKSSLNTRMDKEFDKQSSEVKDLINKIKKLEAANYKKKQSDSDDDSTESDDSDEESSTTKPNMVNRTPMPASNQSRTNASSPMSKN
ncbi:hypothetical protein Ciccas_003158 [Cichlidogyrus casuarinus]|uniref:Uncharacterized protein n=1 Tax=Cichlidogyrus casuarinus TaxID=1844966 RepID=A0ABD2QG51_9PLAT